MAQERARTAAAFYAPLLCRRYYGLGIFRNPLTPVISAQLARHHRTLQKRPAVPISASWRNGTRAALNPWQRSPLFIASAAVARRFEGVRRCCPRQQGGCQRRRKGL